MSLEELRQEKTRCVAMKSAVDGAKSALASFAKNFGDCSASFSAGGLIIDGVGADTYTFGGFNKYVEAKITPIINQLSEASSVLAVAIQQLSTEIRRLEEEARRAAELERKEKLDLSGATNIGDPGFAKKDTPSKYKDPGFKSRAVPNPKYKDPGFERA